ncbi:hypothetical protein QCF76_gp04 [Escherichia phage ZCEC5]|uniref:hypothetical protein n=1 Tax=Escherichia phage ZCEC5 TaxID=2530021 RepID=UPI0010B3DC0C|nr:hypothetical protein QCF76_gp04 [Escherichia phage ZCEC5]QBJ02954.1 hypothetical protein [Escherichia phage ZCEC5]
MKVKAVEVDASCEYVTEGSVYECSDYLPKLGLVFLTGDGGEEVIGLVDGGKDAHGVKWEIVE